MGQHQPEKQFTCERGTQQAGSHSQACQDLPTPRGCKNAPAGPKRDLGSQEKTVAQKCIFTSPTWETQDTNPVPFLPPGLAQALSHSDLIHTAAGTKH